VRPGLQCSRANKGPAGPVDALGCADQSKWGPVVNNYFQMPQPAPANYTPDPAHLRALLSEEMRKLGRGR